MEQQSYPGRPSERDGEPRFSNPMARDGINTPDTRHVRSLFVNLAIIAGFILVVLFALDLAAYHLTPYIPFRWERELFDGDVLAAPFGAEEGERREELRGLADRVAAVMELPDDMAITVYYSPDATVNAYTVPGGNIVVYQGLIDRLESEDELAMVLAHEIAHVKHRDIVRGMVRALGIGLVMAGLQDAGPVADQAARLGMAGYSRSQEEAADAEAVKALGKLYGHAGGAKRFFTTLAFGIERKTDASIILPPILASHPDSRARLRQVEAAAKANGFAAEGELTPLPAAFLSGMTEEQE